MADSPIRPRQAPRRGRGRAVPLLALAAALAGCATGEPLYHSSAPMAGGAEGTAILAPGQAMLQLPPALAEQIVTVRRKAVGGLLQEEVVVANRTVLPRENRITLRRSTRTGEGLLPRSAPLPRMTEEALALAGAREFPKGAIEQPVAFGRNGYGGYAYKASRLADGTSCVLAWQTIDAAHTVEYRVCDPSADTALLLRPFEQFSLRG